MFNNRYYKLILNSRLTWNQVVPNQPEGINLMPRWQWEAFNAEGNQVRTNHVLKAVLFHLYH